jgi:hypothetical protein
MCVYFILNDFSIPIYFLLSFGFSIFPVGPEKECFYWQWRKGIIFLKGANFEGFYEYP